LRANPRLNAAAPGKPAEAAAKASVGEAR